MKPNPLDAAALYQPCDPQQFAFTTTRDLENLGEVIGQDRALEALRFGVGIKQHGYNIYALGPPGTGKHTAVRQMLAARAAEMPPPSDWCYLYNFADPNRPRTLSMAPGKCRVFRDDMARLVENLRTAIPGTFESEEYRTRVQEIEEEFKEKQSQAIAGIQQRAREQGIDLIRTPAGFALAPTRDGEVLSPEEFERLPEEEQARISKIVAGLQDELRKAIRLVPLWRQETRDRIKALNREIANAAAGHLIDTLCEQYAGQPQILEYLAAVREDVVENIDDFRHQEEASGGLVALPGAQSAPFRRYEVNVIVDHDEEQGAPVLYETLPTYQNLMGRLEHIAFMGALITDFTLLKAGALHRANGGYLILDANQLLMQPFAWESLKRALKSRELRIEAVERMLSLVSTVSLEPEPVPLDVKVVLLGDRLLYYLLCQYDPDFSELFKVAADFDDIIDRSPGAHQLFARVIATLARRDTLRPFDRMACARIIEHSSRLAGDAEKLSAHMRGLVNLLHEADYWAGEGKSEVVTGADVQRAIDAQERRADRVRERAHESILRGNVLLDTAGEAIGQINGLSVIELGNYAFGIPHRITAQVRLGEGDVIDIEREVELGGPIHSKGVLILSGLLGARYAANIPLSLAATLVFEQTYNEVEGDSASSAELYALLSALAGVPLSQSLAVTGSVNQKGQVQAIGGVNEKIEGYFDICRARGLSGEQGVLIPAANVKHLMLRRDVVEAAAAGKFHIYPVETIDEGIEILSGVEAGEADPTGQFPENTFNYHVCARLMELANIRHTFGDHKDTST